MIIRDLQEMIKRLVAELKLNNERMARIVKNFTLKSNPSSKFDEDLLKLYPLIVKEMSKLWSWFPLFIASIGQKQLLRKQIATILSFSAKLDSTQLYCALETMNKSLIEDLKNCYRDKDKKFTSPKIQVFSTLTPYLENVGLSDPLTRIYITTDPITYLPTIIFFLILYQIPKFQYNSYLGTLPKSKKDEIDSAAFVVGLISFLNQFHQNNTLKLLALIGQYIRIVIYNAIESTGKNQPISFPPEVHSMILFLELFCRYSRTPREVIEEYIPSYLFSIECFSKIVRKYIGRYIFFYNFSWSMAISTK